MSRLKKIFKWGKKYWYLICATFILTIVLQYLFSFLPIFTQYGINLLSNKSVENINFPDFYLTFLKSIKGIPATLTALGVTLIIIQFFRSIMRFLDSYIKGKITENVSRDMKTSLYEHIGDLSYSYHNNVDTGDLIQRCTSDVETSSSFLSNRFPEIINIIATVGCGAYQVAMINFPLMIMSIITTPIIVISSVIYFKYVNRSFKKIEESEAKMMTVIQENLAGARVVRAFATEKHEIEKLEKANKDFSNKSKAFSGKMALYWGFSEFMIFLQYGITIIYGIYLAKTNVITSADLVAAVMLMGMLIWPFRSMGRLIADFGKTLVAVDRIDEVLSKEVEYKEDGALTPKVYGNIEFRDVKFKFDDDTKYVLDGVSFNIKKGEMVAIVGRTGSGKSTIVNLISRLLDYESGDILIDGVNLKDIKKRHIRRNVGMVLQDPFLFSKTVYENIAIANKNATKEQVIEAAKLSSVDEDIKEFENGYDTIVGERGTTLSGGQKQRIAIARILVEERPIVIFDDSLSAVDTKTDVTIRNSLKKAKQDMTMIIITHRTTTAKEADKIIVLDDGKVSDIGTHEELSKKEGLYKELWDVQGRLEEQFLSLIGGEGNE